MYIVYMHTFKTTEKSYIGFTSKSMAMRLHKHYTNAMSGIDTHFYRAIRKYGLDDIKSTILWEGESKSEAIMIEKRYIQQFDTFKNGYNQTLGGDGGWCVPDEKYDEWIKKITRPMERNPRWSGYTDEEILQCAHEYFTRNGFFSVLGFQKYSSQAFNMPKRYSKNRFSGKPFREAYSERFNIPLEELKYKKTEEHKKNLASALNGRKWYDNHNLKISKLLKPEEVTPEWEKGRSYGTKNQETRNS